MKTMLKAVAGGLVLGAAATGFAADPSVRAELDALKQRVQAQDVEIQQLRSASGESWLNERRAEEVKALVREVLADADTRASLAEGGMTAGYKDGFFIASEDGNFLLRLKGQTQIRYIYNNNPDADDDDDVRHEDGFSVPRVKIGFYGHLFDPKFTYGIRMVAGDVDTEPYLQASVDEGEFLLEEAWFAYEFADGWHVKAGQFKGPFLRDELVDSQYQLAVERASLTDFATIDYTQGMQLSYTTEQWRVAGMLHDGSYAANTDWDGDAVDFAVAGRGEFLVAGNWEQFMDYATWEGNSFGLMIGAAADYENGSGETSFTSDDIFKWTVDVSAEFPEIYGLNAFGALIGLHNDERGDMGDSESDHYGFVLQAGIFVVPNKMDVFGRWEYLDIDEDLLGDEVDGELNLVTVGTNYYFRRHAAKLTVDVVWVADSLEALDDADISTINEDLQGLFTTFDDDQFAVRGQFQFLF